MPRKRADEVNERFEEQSKDVAVEKQGSDVYEVAPAFAKYSSFLLSGGVVVPVKDGKVTVASKSAVAKLRKGGFIR